MREALVLKEIIQKLISLNMRFVFVKTDLKLVVYHLASINNDINEFDLVIEDCQTLLGVAENYQVLYVKRIINIVVNCLAINYKIMIGI